MSQKSSISAGADPVLIITAHHEFIDAAFDELKCFDKSLLYGELLAPGILLCNLPRDTHPHDLSSLTRQAKIQRPIFVRHLAPVQTIIHLSNTENDIGELALAIANLPTFTLIERGQRFAVQTRLLQTDMESVHAGSNKHSYSSGHINQLLAEAIAEETGAVESIKKPQVVVSLLCTLEKAYLGISLTSDNLSDWPGGARHFAHLPNQISRAEYKLLEALEVFGVALPSQGSALDLGAAPGGWTRMLLEAGMRVIAVDPAKLDTRLARQPHLEHYRGYAEDYLEDAVKRRRKFDVITNDMRMDAREAARLLVEASTCLYGDGFIISVLKLPHETSEIDPLKNLSEALTLLRRHFAIVQARQLFHNRQEVTVLTASPHLM
ncbi:MAG TPA: SAM-dependent methyltransferase [Ktedonobacteraceae bacterium]|nr:SAM-dependent methyltransferase [Ktedonobacteraceae bacterium]